MIDTFNLREVSDEAFDDYLKRYGHVGAELAEVYDEDVDLAVVHYTDLDTGQYIATKRVTEDGAINLIPEETIIPSSLHERFYGA